MIPDRIETRGRKKKYDDMQAYSFRFPRHIITAIDDLADEESENLGYTITRTDLVTKAITDLIIKKQVK